MILGLGGKPKAKYVLEIELQGNDCSYCPCFERDLNDVAYCKAADERMFGELDHQDGTMSFPVPEFCPLTPIEASST